MGMSQTVFFTYQDVLKHVRRSVAALHGRDIEGEIREKVTGSARRDVQ